MKATFETLDPVPQLMDDLVDALYLLDACRKRGTYDVTRLLEYIEYTLDEIERYRLGMSSELFATIIADEVEIDTAC
jgi:hypothetical protein